MHWWGHSKENGWVVLDRNIPCNAPARKDDLTFFRYRDATTYVEARKNWNPPSYVFASNYLGGLSAAAAADALAELETFKSLWPGFQRELALARQQAEERAEAARVETEKQLKAAAREKKKLAALSPE